MQGKYKEPISIYMVSIVPTGAIGIRCWPGSLVLTAEWFFEPHTAMFLQKYGTPFGIVKKALSLLVRRYIFWRQGTECAVGTLEISPGLVAGSYYYLRGIEQPMALSTGDGLGYSTGN